MSLSHTMSMGCRLPILRSCQRAVVSRSPLRAGSPPWRAAFSKTARLRKLDLPALDKKWRAEWDRTKQDSPVCGAGHQQQPKYILPMFPYPSGSLHMGHLRVYTVADVIARFHSLQSGKSFLPMGWDAFGLPAENAALQHGIDPATWTKDNMAKMKEQLQVMNGSWDWDREISTSDPEFYKHTQKIFLMLHDKGLAYQAEAEVNYDPVDLTVLANEQVDANGCSWRSGAKVEKRRLKQWFLKISEFRESLLQDLDVLAKDDAWPERVVSMQRNWLGKSQGTMIKFPLLAQSQDAHAAIEVFTTRPDTLLGVQYLALASTHPAVQSLAGVDVELQAFLDTLPGLPPDSKVGYLLPNLRAINPLAYHDLTPDHAKESIPVYVAPYVLGDYGEGAVMGVPGHDLRDHSFWKQHHYDQPVRTVLAASADESTSAVPNEPFVEHGYMSDQSGPFKGKSSKETGEILVTMLQAAELAKPVEKWRLRDWLVSRQRYWGTPIPIIHCTSCGTVPVPDDQLPVKLPEVDNHWTEGKPGNPLESAHEWANPACPKCGGAAKRDTDTMDTFVDSSWYYMRFVDPHNAQAPFSAEKSSLLPVDLYVGGIEHAILHLLYARFIYKFLMNSSLAPESSSEAIHEPFTRLITQGMVHGKTYIDPSDGRFLRPEEVDLQDLSQPRITASGNAAAISYEKMSKSKFNGVEPTRFIAEHGADATRAHMLFQAPVSDVVRWDGDKISGVTRWLGRIHDLSISLAATSSSSSFDEKHVRRFVEGQVKKIPEMNERELQSMESNFTVWRAVQQTIESVTASYQSVYSLNTVISDLMILSNMIIAERNAVTDVRCAAALTLVRMLAPIAPAFASECWQLLGATESLFSGSVRFPVPDGTLPLMRPRTQPCAVQINGKFRVVVDIPRPQEELNDDKLKAWIVDRILETDNASKLGQTDKLRTAQKTIVVRGGKTVNFVL